MLELDMTCDTGYLLDVLIIHICMESATIRALLFKLITHGCVYLALYKLLNDKVNMVHIESNAAFQ